METINVNWSVYFWEISFSTNIESKVTVIESESKVTVIESKSSF